MGQADRGLGVQELSLAVRAPVGETLAHRGEQPRGETPSEPGDAAHGLFSSTPATLTRP